MIAIHATKKLYAKLPALTSDLVPLALHEATRRQADGLYRRCERIQYQRLE